MESWATFSNTSSFKCLRELSTKCGDLRTICGKSMLSKKMKVLKIRKTPVINSI